MLRAKKGRTNYSTEENNFKRDTLITIYYLTRIFFHSGVSHAGLV